MRLPAAALLFVSSTAVFASGCLELTQSGTGGDDAGASGSSGSAGADAGVTGVACGTELNTGVQLCRATSTCPNVVVDSQAMPHCGFRIRGTAADLVCACGTYLCSGGTFATCTDVAQLLANQTDQGICVQVAEGRCVESASSSPASSNENPACDRECMKDCGGGEACAFVCNCK